MRMFPIVSLVKGERTLETVYKALKLLGDLKHLTKNAEHVLIKVNFISTKTYNTGVTTDPLVVEAIIRTFKEFFDEIYVIESNATMTNADKAFKKTGMQQVCRRNNVRFINLSKEKEKVKIRVPEPEVLKEITIPKIVLNSALISAAKLKTHSETGVTLGMKNMFGILPEKWKFKYHFRGISKVVVDINSIIRPRLTVIDGFYALEGPGPTSGSPVKMDVIIAGEDVVATDAVACHVMGIEPYEIYHIRRAYEKGFGEIRLNKIRIIGTKIEEVKRKFRRK
jgi:uncharacterized protein (DUF362 family)